MYMHRQGEEVRDCVSESEADTEEEIDTRGKKKKGKKSIRTSVRMCVTLSGMDSSLVTFTPGTVSTAARNVTYRMLYEHARTTACK